MNRVKEIRRMRGWTQSQLADAIGVSKNHISRLERGGDDGRGLTQDMAIKVGRALNVQPGDLMPIVTDGSITTPRNMAQLDRAVMAKAMAEFMAIHSGYDRHACDRLGMAAVKFYDHLYNQAVHGTGDYFDLEEAINRLDPDHNIDEEAGK